MGVSNGTAPAFGGDGYRFDGRCVRAGGDLAAAGVLVGAVARSGLAEERFPAVVCSGLWEGLSGYGRAVSWLTSC